MGCPDGRGARGRPRTGGLCVELRVGPRPIRSCRGAGSTEAMSEESTESCPTNADQLKEASVEQVGLYQISERCTCARSGACQRVFGQLQVILKPTILGLVEVSEPDRENQTSVLRFLDVGLCTE